jgi:excisionase family DNA binding protein
VLSVQEAADRLGISKRMMYDLAAPRGPVPCYRIETAVRFDENDVEDYKQSRRCEPVKAPEMRLSQRAVRLKMSSPEGESGLMKLFRRDGLTPKTKAEIDAVRKKPRK